MSIPRLTDRQCHVFLRDMHAFGYPDLTFEEVRKIAGDLADGNKPTCVISVIMLQQIEEAVEDTQ